MKASSEVRRTVRVVVWLWPFERMTRRTEGTHAIGIKCWR